MSDPVLSVTDPRVIEGLRLVDAFLADLVGRHETLQNRSKLGSPAGTWGDVTEVDVLERIQAWVRSSLSVATVALAHRKTVSEPLTLTGIPVIVSEFLPSDAVYASPIVVERLRAMLPSLDNISISYIVKPKEEHES